MCADWDKYVKREGRRDLERGVSEEEIEGHEDRLSWKRRGDKVLNLVLI